MSIQPTFRDPHSRQDHYGGATYKGSHRAIEPMPRNGRWKLWLMLPVALLVIGGLLYLWGMIP